MWCVPWIWQGPGNHNAVEHDRTVRPNSAARAVPTSPVDGARGLGRTEPVKGVDAFDFGQADGARGHPARKRESLDMMGNPMPAGPAKPGLEPIQLRSSVPGTVRETRQTAQAFPFGP